MPKEINKNTRTSITESTPVRLAIGTLAAMVLALSAGYARFTAVEAQTEDNTEEIQVIEEEARATRREILDYLKKLDDRQIKIQLDVRDLKTRNEVE